MKFKLVINCDSSAFVEVDEIEFGYKKSIETARILKEIAKKFENGPYCSEGSEADINGNFVCEWKYTKR